MKTNNKWEEINTFVNVLRYRALENPDGRAYTFLNNNEKEFITYGLLDKKARMTAACLQDYGAYCQPVLLLFQPGIEYICSFFGCLYAGAYAVPSYLPKLNRTDDRLMSIVRDTGTKFALVDKSVLKSEAKIIKNTPDLAGVKWISQEQLEKYDYSEWNKTTVEKTHIAFLQYTSGSTKRPRGVMVSHSNLLHNSEAIRQNFGQSEKSKAVIWLPPYHDMGLIGGIIQPMYSGFEAVLMSPFSFIENPLRWLEAITEYKSTVSGGPDFAYELCTRKISEEQKQSLSLESWEIAFNGSEPIKYQSMLNFYNKFKDCGFRWEAFHPCYGLAEATLLVSGKGIEQVPYICDFEKNDVEAGYVKEAANNENSIKLVSSGTKNKEDKILIINPETVCEQEGKIGEVWIKGPGIASGYWKNEDETSKVFNAFVKNTGEGPFMRTGDLGFFIGNQLFINGRIKDLIIIRGKNHYPQDIEATVEQNLSVLRSGSSAAFIIEKDLENKLVVVAEIERSSRNMDTAPIVETIRKLVSENHGISVYSVIILKPHGMPKTSSGKVQRSLCKKMYLEGSLDAVCMHILEDKEM
ncbi:MAG: hypothetical protein K0R50_3572, partial [Eubacterium sp.]|nr:hypothetical protein [Eubacterium sp.]